MHFKQSCQLYILGQPINGHWEINIREIYLGLPKKTKDFLTLAPLKTWLSDPWLTISAAGLMLATYLVLLVTSALWLGCVRRMSLVTALRAKLVKYLCCSILDTQEHINLKLSLILNLFI